MCVCVEERMLTTGRKGFVRGGVRTGFEVVGAARAQTEQGLKWHATKDLIYVNYCLPLLLTLFDYIV